MLTTERAEEIFGLPRRPDRWNTPLIIMPEQAKRVIQAQPVQRPVSRAHVQTLSNEMKAGRWVMTNEALAFDEDGRLFDGQHRMWACFTSDVPIPLLACFNEPRINFDRIGTLAKKRTYGDQLVISGMTDDFEIGTIAAGVARFLYAYDTGRNPANAAAASSTDWNSDVMRSTLNSHSTAMQRIQEFKSKRRALMPQVPMIALAILMHEADEDRARDFMGQFLSGEGLSIGDPAYALRESALRRTSAQRSFRIEMSYRMVRAWNAFYEGRKLHHLYGSATPMGKTTRIGGMDMFPRVAGHGGWKGLAV